MSIRELITTDGARQQIEAALPKHMTADRQIRVALTALNKTPKLKNCSSSSFVDCLMTCSELGLEPNGRHAHLIPYGDKCTLIIDYKGLVLLAHQSGVVRDIKTDVIYTGDAFDYETSAHTPWEWRDDNRPDDRGKFRGAFCRIEMLNGARHHEVMTSDEIIRIRDRSRAGKSGPWVTDFDEMAKKTVFRRASKWLPLTPHLQDALMSDDDQLATEAKSVDVQPKRLPISSLTESIASDEDMKTEDE